MKPTATPMTPSAKPSNPNTGRIPNSSWIAMNDYLHIYISFLHIRPISNTTQLLQAATTTRITTITTMATYSKERLMS